MQKASFLIILICLTFLRFTSAQYALNEANSVNKTENIPSVTPLPIFNFAGYSYEYELNNITEEMAGRHEFGNEIAKKMFLLGEKYTSQVELIPGNPQTKTVIQKPTIYNGVKRIEKYLKKSVKKGTLSAGTATYTLNKVLDVALSIRNADTKSFEVALEESGTEYKKIELFTKQVQLIY